MKISASIYSDKSRSLQAVVEDLERHQVDMLHIDCNDDLSVFEDIKQIRQWCTLPLDLHIITEEPEKYYDLLIQNPVEYVTFQFENLKSILEIPAEVTGKKGLAVITPTSVQAFDQYPDFDFILIMATIPGQSGGVFDKLNFDKIRQFRKKYPSKSIHVDGGVNGEVSFILRNMGVSSSVSGSYLFKEASIGNALMNLTKRSVTSQFKVEDFMTPMDECPVVVKGKMEFQEVLETIDQGLLGFTLVTDEDGKFKGIISNADIRKALMRAFPNYIKLDLLTMINEKPITVFSNYTVDEMLKVVKKSPFTVSYLPVVNQENKAVGIVNFANLIKAEL